MRTRAGSVAVMSVLLSAAAVAAAAVQAGSYAGLTSEKSAVSFKIAGHAIKNFRTTLGYNGSCGQGGGPAFTVSVASVKIGPKGGFSAHITLRGPVAAVKPTPGTLKGKVTTGAVHGTIRATKLSFKNCPAPYRETFSATRK